jgi:hypothetical protein
MRNDAQFLYEDYKIYKYGLAAINNSEKNNCFKGNI